MMTALFIAMLIGITVWFILIQGLKSKPWTEQGVIAGSQDGLTSSAPKVGLWVFLGMVASLFLVFTGAYMMRKDHGHGGGMQEWMPVEEPSVLWLNTLVLVLASVAMHLARGAAARTELQSTRKCILAAGGLTLLFLAGQFWAWRILSASGLYSTATPAYTFFVLLTTVHGLHMAGGLVVLGRAVNRMWKADTADVVTVDKLRTSVELCTTYWHFLLIVWIGLLWLLVAT